MCFLSSIPHLDASMSAEFKFNLALIGQALTGIACPFIACVPTKISQHWFADEQRSIATTVLGMSGSVGCILGQGLTPLMVYEPEDIFVMNTVWFVPAAIGSLLTMWKVSIHNYKMIHSVVSCRHRELGKSVVIVVRLDFSGNFKEINDYLRPILQFMCHFFKKIKLK